MAKAAPKKVGKESTEPAGTTMREQLQLACNELSQRNDPETHEKIKTLQTSIAQAENHA